MREFFATRARVIQKKCEDTEDNIAVENYLPPSARGTCIKQHSTFMALHTWQ